MGSVPRTAPRLIAAAIILFGCAPGPGGPSPHNAPTAGPPAGWATDPCIVADTTAPTADTLYTIGVGAPATIYNCSDFRTPSGAAPVVVISIATPPGADLRELMDNVLTSAGDHRPDVIVTRDAAVLAYAGARAGYLTAALPWSTTFVLVPARASVAVVLPTPAERDALARDAVTESARGAAEPFSWLTDSACAASAILPIAAPRAIVAYPAGDAIARQLAERVVSLAGTNAAATWAAAALGDQAAVANLRIAAMPADSIPGALASGRVAGAVLPVARDPRAPCFTAGNARVAAGALPLVDTRAHVVVRRGSGAAFVIAANGWLHFFRRGAP